MRVITGLQTDFTSPSLNLPIIPTFCDIANLLECMVMFYFIKELSVFCGDKGVTLGLWTDEFASSLITLNKLDFQALL
ncbi:MAG: hypothetical protein J6C65_02385 [Prevotella sp.]|nr:hypothetical protein [Prevotella sp.]